MLPIAETNLFTNCGRHDCRSATCMSKRATADYFDLDHLIENRLETLMYGATSTPYAFIDDSGWEIQNNARLVAVSLPLNGGGASELDAHIVVGKLDDERTVGGFTDEATAKFVLEAVNATPFTTPVLRAARKVHADPSKRNFAELGRALYLLDTQTVKRSAS